MGRRLKASDGSKATRHKASPVEVRNIAHPRVWATALTIAGGDHRLIQVITHANVVVMLRK
jgi:hypothetical protein